MGRGRENGEEWRRLKVASHSGEQITHFGPDGLMRRHDYTVEVLGGATGANYSTDYKEFQGIKMPTTPFDCCGNPPGARLVAKTRILDG
jgi:hypothetical protein